MIFFSCAAHVRGIDCVIICKHQKRVHECFVIANTKVHLNIILTLILNHMCYEMNNSRSMEPMWDIIFDDGKGRE